MDKPKSPSNKVANSTKNSHKNKDVQSLNSPSEQEIKTPKSTSSVMNRNDISKVSIPTNSTNKDDKNASRKSISHSNQALNSDKSPIESGNIPNLITTGPQQQYPSISSTNGGKNSSDNSKQLNSEVINMSNLVSDYTNLSTIANASENITNSTMFNQLPSINSTNTIINDLPNINNKPTYNEQSILMPSMLSSDVPSSATNHTPQPIPEAASMPKPPSDNNASESMSQSFEHNNNMSSQNVQSTSSKDFNNISKQLYEAAKHHRSKRQSLMDEEKRSSQTSIMFPSAEYETIAKSASNEVVSVVAIELTKSELALRKQVRERPLEPKSSTVTMTGVRIRNPAEKKPLPPLPAPIQKPKTMEPLPISTSATPNQSNFESYGDLFNKSLPIPAHTAPKTLGDFKLDPSSALLSKSDLEIEQNKAITSLDTVSTNARSGSDMYSSAILPRDCLNTETINKPLQSNQYMSTMDSRARDTLVNFPASNTSFNNTILQPAKEIPMTNVDTGKGKNQCKRNVSFKYIS